MPDSQKRLLLCLRLTTGDFVLLAEEVNPVVRALTENGINVTAIHSHMLFDNPRLYMLHFWAIDNPENISKGLKAALGFRWIMNYKIRIIMTLSILQDHFFQRLSDSASRNCYSDLQHPLKLRNVHHDRIRLSCESKD